MLPTESQERKTMAQVSVNGKVLIWARKIRGLSIERAAELLGITVDELGDYEAGRKRPLIGFLRRMSAEYRINFTSLLMPEPLPIPKQPTDYRVRHGKQPLSIDTLVAMEEVSEALDAFEDIGETRGVLPRLNIGSAVLDEDPEVVAARERRRFGVSVGEQQLWHGLDGARRNWRKAIEDRGVFTYMIPMPIKELSGFSILRDDVAAICINDREPTDGAKVFTLFHEYCHLLLGQTGISDENNQNRTERFCNRFAASFLIPREPLIETIEDFDIADIGGDEVPYEFSNSDVRRLAARFRVSNSAMALRLEETGIAPRGFYHRTTAPWDIPVEPKRPTGKTQPSPIRTRLKRIGILHAATVLEAVRVRAINSFDASQLIGLQAAYFPKVLAAIG
jgi:Zn-dependent peptidase ImmA (M78 family)